MQTSETTPEAETEIKQTPYQMMGGEAMLRRVTERFYEIMDESPEAAGIRAMHAADLSSIKERLFEFLSGWLGGPPLYFQRPGHNCIMSAHRPYSIGAAERDQWMMCIRRAMEECGVDPEVRKLLDQPFQRMCQAFSTK